MTPSDKLREIVDKTFPLFGSRLDEWRKVERDMLLSDLTALISEGYVSKEEHDKAVQQRDELREALAEQKRLYFNLFDEETSCMYCEAKIRRGSAIILCKGCAENTEV